MLDEVLKDSYQWGKEKKLTLHEMQRLEFKTLKQAEIFAKDGMYLDAWQCRVKADVYRAMIANYKGEDGENE